MAQPIRCCTIMRFPSQSFTPEAVCPQVLGIALASNLGGMTSPISSPQNIFAIERMSLDGQ